MEFDEALKRYKRFMKEYGLYSRMIFLHTTYTSYFSDVNGFKRTKKKKAFKELLTSTNDPVNKWIQNSSVFCTWSGTKEGDTFWWLISMLWEVKCYNEEIFLENRPRVFKQDIIWEFDSLKTYVGNENKNPFYKELKEKIEKL